MANFFDQFDEAPDTTNPRASAQGQNFFDQFDAAPVGPRDEATVQAEYDAMPWYAKAGTAADDVMRAVANGFTLGYADKIAGWAGGEGTEAERAKTDEAWMRGGSAMPVATIGGSIATGLGAARNGATLIGRFGTGAMTGAKGLGARAGLAAIEGAGYGALSAMGQDEDISDGALMGAITGGLASPAVEGVQAIGRGLLRGTSPSIMTEAEALAKGNAAYKAADEAGVAYTPQAIDRLRSSVVEKLADFGYDPILQPGAAAVLKRLDDLGGQNVTLKGLDTLYKVANNGYIPGNKANNKVVGMLAEAIDSAAQNPAADDVLMGDPNVGAAALETARDMWRRVSRSAQVRGALTDAEFQAARSGSGGNVDNAIRQRLDSIRKSGARGFTPDEREALETAIKGSSTQNFFRRLGAFSPDRTFGPWAGITSAASFGPLGAAIPIGGWIANKVAGDIGRRNVDNLVNIFMNGGVKTPLNGPQQFVEDMYEPLIRAIIGYSESPDLQPAVQRHRGT